MLTDVDGHSRKAARAAVRTHRLSNETRKRLLALLEDLYSGAPIVPPGVG